LPCTGAQICVRGPCRTRGTRAQLSPEARCKSKIGVYWYSMSCKIGVSWYLFSNHCTCKCIHKRVITNKGVVPLWCSRASCRLPPHGVSMLRMLIALPPHPSVLRGWEFAQNTSPHTASPHPRRRASILTLFKNYGPGVLVNVCSPAVLGSAFLSRTLLGDSRFYGPARR